MKGSRWIAALAIAGLTAAAVASARMPQSSVRARAAAAYRLRALAGPNGQFAGQQYQSALRARAQMLAHGAVARVVAPPGSQDRVCTAPRASIRARARSAA